MEPSKAKEGSIGLSYPMLTRSNYTAWSLKMKVFMKAQGVWDAIEMKDPKETIDEKMVQIALAAIYQGVPDDILLTIAEKKTAKEAWDGIKILCMGATRVKEAKVQTLRSEFESLVMKETDQVDDFCMKLRVAEVVGRLKAHEERMKGKSESTIGQLLLIQEEWAKRSNKNGPSTTHIQRQRGGFGGTNRGYNNTRDRGTVKCFNCQVYGHYAHEYRKPKKEKEKVKEQSQESNLTNLEDDEPTLLLTEGEVVLLNEEKVLPSFYQKEGTMGNGSLWYLDNGASNHMTGYREKFSELNENVTGHVRFGDGSTGKIKGKGTIIFNCKNGKEHVLKEVYFIPTLCNNIISLGQLSEDGNKVVMSGHHLWVGNY
ncbi:uncharacterized protein LOC141720250 [Apium graveolens]|uniref:uncharacterized protein LOC141720250 n=1 Tax=Apium graveolens TaxID=4045 RepID=UPI003D79B4D8